MIGGDFKVFDRDIVATNDAVDMDLGSRSNFMDSPPRGPWTITSFEGGLHCLRCRERLKKVVNLKVERLVTCELLVMSRAEG